MNSLRIYSAVFCTVAIGSAFGLKQLAGDENRLSTGKVISPIGESVGVGSFPSNMALSPDGKWIAVTDTGFRENLTILDAHSGAQVSTREFKGKQSLYYGIAWAPSSDGARLYFSRGPEDIVSEISVDSSGNLGSDIHSISVGHASTPSVPLFPAGLAANSDGSRLYVANNESSAFTDFKGSLSMLDTQSGQQIGTIETPGFPLAVAAIHQGDLKDHRVFVTSEMRGVVSCYDVTDPSHPRLVKDIPVGDHPSGLALDPKESFLYVANSGSDTVSVIDTHRCQVVRTLLVRPAAAKKLPGATPIALTVAPAGNRLYVCLGDLNAVAVVDLSKNKLVGYLPTGWYPSSVVVSPDGGSLFIASAKGIRAKNPNGTKQGPDGAWGTYIDNIIEGSVTKMDVPADSALPALTETAMTNAGLAHGLETKNNLGGLGIKHVVYIIKENRTYDQVMGDVAEGNGDPGLTLFGRQITPNQHALAKRFVLLDNFYCCAETSGDGWDWSLSGMASEYSVRNLPFNYSGRGRGYDFEGQTNGTAVDIEGLPDVAEAPGGYIWDLVRAKGLSYRNYGFYMTFGSKEMHNGKPLAEDNTPAKKALVGHSDQDFYRFGMDYPDSEAWVSYHSAAPRQRKSYGSHQAPSRFSEWKREFDEQVRTGTMPAFTMVRFPRDHTSGTSIGLNSPRAMVADNDYAVGQLVEAISKSPYWKDTAIFVVEDDAQDGEDHVDAHRSPCYVISPRIQSGLVDHHFYNTDSVLRTMEVLMGLHPMTQTDAVAPLMNFFQASAVNPEPYNAILPEKEIVTEVNTASSFAAKESSRLDFSREDRVPGKVMTRILEGEARRVAR